MTTESRKPLNNEYLFRASWGGTKLEFWIEAPDATRARKRAERYVNKMEGRWTVIDLDLIRWR